MAVVYFDASALVKLFVDETGSEVAAQIWDDSAARLSSRLAYPEVCGALGAARRNHILDQGSFVAARRTWGALWGTMRHIGLTPGVEQLAGELAVERALRGSDAVHLASALALEHDDFVLAAWDERLRRGALAEGLTVVPTEP